MDVDFCVDAIVPWEICGWAWLPHNPGAPISIEMVSVDGKIIARDAAHAFRSDLAAAGKRSGWCGFTLAIPSETPTGIYGLRARVGEDCRLLIEAFQHDQPAVCTTPADAPNHFDGGLFDDSGAKGHLDLAGPDAFVGWIHRGPRFGPVQSLDLVADEAIVCSSRVDGWRSDLEDHFHGDGRVGFEIVIPAALRDGLEHSFDLRWSGDCHSLLRAPITLNTASAPPIAPAAAEPTSASMPPPPSPNGPIELSIIVNFYNMPHEAERTLTSLSRLFQRDIDDLSYEVLCIDNGSSPAIEEASVTRHGTEFQLFRPSAVHPSPVFALNEAAAAARGRFLAVMIDGAHLLSPGVLAEAVAALRSERRAIVAIRHWFIGGDQRWLSTVGYTGDHQDIPFAKIGWPRCGYDIFKISTPIFDSPNTWFDSMSESNCLFLSTEDFAEMGGYDPSFSTPGGGFANLDLFSRASRLQGMSVIALIGEATFHQYHGGTTTNVTDAEKESRVRRYASSFETLRERAYEPVSAEELKFRGGMHSDYAMNARQRPNGKVRLGLTSLIRPIPAARSFEEGARAFARTAYVESGAYQKTIWAGQPTGVAPADLVEIQQMLWNERPDVLVLADVDPGLLAFIRSIMPAILLEGLKLIWLTSDAAAGATPPGVCRLIGDIGDAAIRQRIQAEIGSAERISVMYQPRSDVPMPEEPVRQHASFVSVGGYLVVLGAAFGQPGIGYSTQWTSNAIHRFLANGAPFVIDQTMNAHFITTCPSGFLRRLPERQADRIYDDKLDILTEFEVA